MKIMRSCSYFSREILLRPMISRAGSFQVPELFVRATLASVSKQVDDSRLRPR